MYGNRSGVFQYGKGCCELSHLTPPHLQDGKSLYDVTTWILIYLYFKVLCFMLLTSFNYEYIYEDLVSIS